MQLLKKQRVASALQRALGEIFLHEGLVNLSVTAVEISSRLETARVYYSLLDEEGREPTQKLLNQKQPYFRHLIAKKLNLRLTPLLIFTYDDSEKKAFHLRELINQEVK